MLIGKYFPRQFPTVASVEDVAPFVQARIDEGADYVRFLFTATSPAAELSTVR